MYTATILYSVYSFFFRGAENRTRTFCSQSRYTTTILRPAFAKATAGKSALASGVYTSFGVPRIPKQTLRVATGQVELNNFRDNLSGWGESNSRLTNPNPAPKFSLRTAGNRTQSSRTRSVYITTIRQSVEFGTGQVVYIYPVASFALLWGYRCTTSRKF
jgi:hypothetical protein